MICVSIRGVYVSPQAEGQQPTSEQYVPHIILVHWNLDTHRPPDEGGHKLRHAVVQPHPHAVLVGGYAPQIRVEGEDGGLGAVVPVCVRWNLIKWVVEEGGGGMGAEKAPICVCRKSKQYGRL